MDAKRILSGQDKDLALTDGDVVIVPSSRVAIYLETMTPSAISSSMLLIGRL